MLLRPIRPNEIENAKISRNNQSEFHHFDSFAEKHTTNHSTPAIEKMMLARPNGRLFSASTILFKIEIAFHDVIYLRYNARLTRRGYRPDGVEPLVKISLDLF